MKFCFDQGFTEDGPTVIEYTYPVLSSAARDDVGPVLDGFQYDIEEDNQGNTKISNEQMAATNTNRQTSYIDGIAKHYVDHDKPDEVELKTVFLRIPKCPCSGNQLVSGSDVWQGDC